MSTVWIAVALDRHIDPEVRAFHTKDDATSFVREYLRDHVGYPDGLKEQDSEDRWFMWYEYESDNGFVVKSEVA